MKLALTIEVEIEDVPEDMLDDDMEADDLPKSDEYSATELANVIADGLPGNYDLFAGTNVYACFGEVKVLKAEIIA